LELLNSFDRISLIQLAVIFNMLVEPSSATTNNVPTIPGNIFVDVSGNISVDVSGNVFGNIKNSSRLRSEKDISRNILGINIFGNIPGKIYNCNKNS